MATTQASTKKIDVGFLAPLFRTAGHTGRNQHGVTACPGLRRVDVVLGNYLPDQAGSRSLIFDLSITHQRYGSSSHPLQNGHLPHLQDIDAPLHIASQRKINSYRQQYADNQNISFLPAITSTSTRMHGELLRILFYRPTGRQRRTSLPLACHRKATNRTRPVQTRGILPVAQEQSRTRGGQSGSVEDEPQYPGLWRSRTPNARSLSRSPSSPPSFFHTISLSPAFTCA